MNTSESPTVEFKLDASSKSYLKTVSAYANYGDGVIEFGRANDGIIVGIEDPKQLCHNIENQINDSIRPLPNYKLEIDPERKIVSLYVKEGDAKPYLFQNKAYRRSDTSTISVDREEFRRLILEGMNVNYESLPARNQNLQFNYLETRLIEKLGIEKLSKDILRTLDLFNDKNGYTLAAEILSDENQFPGIDFARMGETLDVFLERRSFVGYSILEQFDQALEYISSQYRYEQVIGASREVIETIPLKAIRETLANAVVHRAWDVNASIRVIAFANRLEVSSPGGLPSGMTEADYLRGQVSLLRNPIIAGVFYRLSIIEQFGTGILRILQAYKDSFAKPAFRISPNVITVVLPLLNDPGSIEPEERALYNLLRGEKELSRVEIERRLNLNKAKSVRLLNALIEKNAIERVGTGRGTTYRIL
jgi:ATP-dependent DNA helicase RecG